VTGDAGLGDAEAGGENEQSLAVPLLYTKPAEATQYRDHDGIISHFMAVVDALHPRKWAWCFDAQDLRLKHVIDPRTGIKLAQVLSQRYASSIVAIHIIHANAVVRCALWFVYPFLSYEVREKIFVSSGQ
jgi:hypothetical protein